MIAFEEQFGVERANGCLVAFSLPEFRPDADVTKVEGLSPREKAFVDTLEPRRAISFVGGRLALRAVLTRLGAPTYESLPNPRGAPIVPRGYRASISHKDDIAVAYACVDRGMAVGIDVEVSEPDRSRIARKVLTEDELEAISEMTGSTRWHAILRRFSLKEAVYKAIDPFVERYVGFQEVAVNPTNEADIQVDLRLRTNESLDVRCEQFQRADYILSLAKARISPPA